MTDLEDVGVAAQELGMSARDLWIGYFAVGGNCSLTEVEQWLAGSSDPSDQDRDLLAQAVNDEFVARNLDHPIRYRADS